MYLTAWTLDAVSIYTKRDKYMWVVHMTYKIIHFFFFLSTYVTVKKIYNIPKNIPTRFYFSK